MTSSPLFGFFSEWKKIESWEWGKTRGSLEISWRARESWQTSRRAKASLWIWTYGDIRLLLNSRHRRLRFNKWAANHQIWIFWSIFLNDPQTIKCGIFAPFLWWIQWSKIQIWRFRKTFSEHQTWFFWCFFFEETPYHRIWIFLKKFSTRIHRTVHQIWIF